MIEQIQSKVCKVDVDQWTEIVKKIPTDLRETKEQVDKLILTNTQRLDTAIAEVRTSVTNLGSGDGSINLSAPQIRQVTSEVKEIESRKLNVIISGLPEGTNDREDLIHYCNVYHKQTNAIVSQDLDTVERVGRKSTAPRLIRVKLQSQDARRNLLTMHNRKLKDQQVPNVYVRPDLTHSQQELDKQLRDELKARGKERYKIYRGCIVLREGQLPSPMKSKAVDRKVYQTFRNSNMPTGVAGTTDKELGKDGWVIAASRKGKNC